mmetsp:Transcript_55862/g.92795  ORF Transcript_55862/g.92795 Transcript_55862/m.92795 type:complete len:251 (-) Transcript_55862:1247-1999(-)
MKSRSSFPANERRVAFFGIFGGKDTPLLQEIPPRKPPPAWAERFKRDVPKPAMRAWLNAERLFTRIPGGVFIIDMSIYYGVTTLVEKQFGWSWITGGLLAGAALGGAKPIFASVGQAFEDSLLNASLSQGSGVASAKQLQSVVRRPLYCGPEIRAGGAKALPDQIADDTTLRCLIQGQKQVGVVMSVSKGISHYGDTYKSLMSAASACGIQSIDLGGAQQIIYSLGNATPARKIRKIYTASASAAPYKDW